MACFLITILSLPWSNTASNTRLHVFMTPGSQGKPGRSWCTMASLRRGGTPGCWVDLALLVLPQVAGPGPDSSALSVCGLQGQKPRSNQEDFLRLKVACLISAFSKGRRPGFGNTLLNSEIRNDISQIILLWRSVALSFFSRTETLFISQNNSRSD